MLEHIGPIGINFSSLATWCAIVVGVVVAALTVSTRRGIMRPRSGAARTRAESLPGGARLRYAGEWSAAQASFVENPRIGCRRAQLIVSSALEARGFALTPELLDRRYRAGCAIIARRDASIDELRRAYFDFRAAFEALVADESEVLDP